jgi:hypothetical protein
MFKFILKKWIYPRGRKEYTDFFTFSDNALKKANLLKVNNPPKRENFHLSDKDVLINLLKS